MRTVTLRSAGPPETTEAVTVAFDRVAEGGAETYAVRVGESAYEVPVEWHSANGGWLRVHGRIVPFHTVVGAESVQVWIGGKTYALQRVDRRSRRSQAGAAAIASDEIKAPMPGTILKINVGVGGAFAADDPILVMESMKMEMSLSSPIAGRVKEIRCRVGELVELGAVLAKLELIGSKE